MLGLLVLAWLADQLHLPLLRAIELLGQVR
jgi:hypothetical protein